MRHAFAMYACQLGWHSAQPHAAHDAWQVAALTTCGLPTPSKWQLIRHSQAASQQHGRGLHAKLNVAVCSTGWKARIHRARMSHRKVCVECGCSMQARGGWTQRRPLQTVAEDRHVGNWLQSVSLRVVIAPHKRAWCTSFVQKERCSAYMGSCCRVKCNRNHGLCSLTGNCSQSVIVHVVLCVLLLKLKE